MSSPPIHHDGGLTSTQNKSSTDESINSSQSSRSQHGTHKGTPSTSKPVQKSRTKQPPNTLMVSNLIKVDRSPSSNTEIPSVIKSKVETPLTGTKPKYQKNHRKSRTSESESSKTSSVSYDGKGNDGSDDGSLEETKGTSKLPVLKKGFRKDRSADSSRKTTPKTPRKSPKPFEPYVSLEEVQRGLKKGELIEGILRINPKNYEDAYISAPDGEMDIYIGGILDRNRALHGDVVIVELKPQHEWKVLWDNIKTNEPKSGIPVPIAHSTLVTSGDTIEIVATGGTKKSRRGKRGGRKKKSLYKEIVKSEVGNSQTDEQLEGGGDHKKRRNRKRRPKKAGAEENNYEFNIQCEGMVFYPSEMLAGVLDSDVMQTVDEVEEEDEQKEVGRAVAPHELSETEDHESLKEEGSVCSDELERLVEMVEFMNNNSTDETVGWGDDVVVDDHPLPITSWSETNQQINIDNNIASVAYENTSVDESPLSRHKMTVSDALKHPLASKYVQRTARVVYLKERKHNLVAVGHIKLMQDKSPLWALFSPQDHRLPRLMIPMNECPSGFFNNYQNYAKTLFVARVSDWDNTGLAKGHLYRSLGEAGLIATETEAILISNSVDYSDFPDDLVQNYNTQQPWIIPEEELKYRRDFRKECVFTIDPSTARDLDDAMSCKLLKDNSLEIGVHIADVSYFVPEGSKVDQIAASRATSVYLVQTVVPMLPRLLCEQLCSLNPGDDRLTMSVVWKISSKGEILEEWFGRTVINSCAKLSYEHAQKMIEEPAREWMPGELPQIHGDFPVSMIVGKVQQLHQIALILRKNRFEGGALCLNQVKLNFVLDLESGFPSGFSVYEQKDSNRLIEEFMLLANMAVAHKLIKTFPTKAVLRCHPPPQRHMLDEIIEIFSTIGIFIDSASAGKIQESLSNLKKDSTTLSSARQLVLISLLAKPMQRALYFCAGCCDNEENYHHYALNVPLYTHFTSPIRRYADILVHRLLAAALNYSMEPQTEKMELKRQCDHCNDKKYSAKIVQELSQELFLGAFIKEGGPREEVAMVIGVLDHSFDVLVLQFGVIKRVYCNQLPLIMRTFQKIQGIPHLTITWGPDNTHPSTAQTITLFSAVIVELIPADEALKFNAVLKRPEATPPCFPPNFSVPKI